MLGIHHIGRRIWMLLSFTVAVRQALDYRSTMRAIGICLIGWLLYAGMLFGMMPRASASGFIAGSGTSTRPSIVRLEPDSGKPGDTITAYGTSLDSSTVENIYLTDGTVTALVNIIEQNVTSLRFRIPTMLEKGRYTVVISPARVWHAASTAKSTRLLVKALDEQDSSAFDVGLYREKRWFAAGSNSCTCGRMGSPRRLLKVASILTGVIGHTGMCARVEQLVRQRRDGTRIPPRIRVRPCLGAQCGRNQSPAGAKMIAASSRDGGSAMASPAQTAPFASCWWRAWRLHT